MKSGLKQSWVETLRSGNYTQGILYLRNSFDECCCLGVLCDITNSSEWNKDKTSTWHMRGLPSFPEDDLLKSWGLPLAHAKQLARMNDAGTPFGEIADWIERNV